ncbi:penicillin-binding protein [Nocardioides baekrokdamisoli]|uniref:Penicillin-binding protein n=1 Tax=Nocardioides baekrokdamisoli TaxID=1804624 RepID=A0A3G9IGG1_9ACTN|nr:transglycosylase domain-containing protein [Nocardioides baekrokdamisoli]BBH17406.1 penicillin-binding protein [Nocardioides baekrokdamisoli]
MSNPAKKPAARRPAAPQGAWDKFRAMNSKRRWILALKWSTVISLSFVLFIVAAGFVMYETTKIPDPNAAYESQASLVYYSDGKTVIGDFSNQYRISLTYNQMPATIKDAVVAAEDRTFWTNNGIDLRGILRALVNNAGGNSLQGASTITQQYVKLVYLNSERSYTRKVKEAILALKLEQSISKQEILTRYLNAVYFGRSAYGIEAASEAYFGIHAAKLNTRQAAMLASIINNPNNLDPRGSKAEKTNLTKRYDYVLQGMVSTGNLKEAVAQHYIALGLPDSKPQSVNRNTLGDQKGHILQLVKNQLLSLGFSSEQIDRGGLRITTTLQKKGMDAAECGVIGRPGPNETRADPCQEFGAAVPANYSGERPSSCYYGTGDACLSDKNLHIGVAMVKPGTGDLVGFYGGQDYVESQLNWAATGGMAGSSMKPITLATAIEAGYTLKSTWTGGATYGFYGASCQPFVPSSCVQNEADAAGQPTGYGHPLTSVEALENSVNTAFSDMTMSIPNGPKAIYNNALAMGLTPNTADPKHPVGIPTSTTDLLPDDVRITLGKAHVSPINMANTYATIADGGQRADVHVVQTVTDANGAVKYQFKQHTTQAIPQDVSDDVSYAMQQVVLNGTGKNAMALGRPAAGKTGTATNGNNDVSSAWFSGFTPQMATSVMYVRGNGTEKIDRWMPSYFGADYPTRTWTEVMKLYLTGEPTEQFPPPANVSGTAPQSGHTYTPPPPPPPAPKPTKTPTSKPTKTKTPKPNPGGGNSSGTPSSSPTGLILPRKP